MIAYVLHGRDLAIVSVLLAFLAFLLYRIFRKEPTDRLVRIGVFIERRMEDEAGEKTTERHEWPRQKEEDL